MLASLFRLSYNEDEESISVSASSLEKDDNVFEEEHVCKESGSSNSSPVASVLEEERKGEEREFPEKKVLHGGYSLSSQDHDNEDRYFVSKIPQDKKKTGESLYFAGVYDGHGGHECAKFLKQRFHKIIEKEHKKGADEDLQCLLKRCFDLAEKEFVHKKAPKSGACAAVALIRGNTVVVGNVGDCMVYVEEECLTFEHRAEVEKERITASKGWIADKRVFGVLQPSRTIGDFDMKHNPIPPPPMNRKLARKLKKEGGADNRPPLAKSAQNIIIADPYLSSYTSNTTPSLLVMGSDGLFDVLSGKEALEYASAHSSSDLSLIATELCQMARTRRSKDDITCVLVKF